MDNKADTYYIEQVLEGRVQAFSHLVDRHKDRVFNLTLRICGNREEAEEVAQDAFLKAYRSLSSFKMKSSFATWLYRIAYNTAISCIRSRKKGILSLEDFPVTLADFAGNDTSEEEAEIEYRRSLVNFAMQKLDEDERGLISLYYYEEMNTDELSEVTGISKANIKVRLFRARQKMIGIIEKIEKKNLICHETGR
jgi:RNA polymerase sigma-70 factor (ECF subfamily)